jgi:hypothetical protein
MNITEFSTFLGLVIIKLFLEKWNFLEILCLKCWKLKKFCGGGGGGEKKFLKFWNYFQIC